MPFPQAMDLNESAEFFPRTARTVVARALFSFSITCPSSHTHPRVIIVVNYYTVVHGKHANVGTPRARYATTMLASIPRSTLSNNNYNNNDNKLETSISLQYPAGERVVALEYYRTLSKFRLFEPKYEFLREKPFP